MADGERETEEGRQRPPARGPWRAVALVSGIGTQLAGSVLIGLYVGRQLDRLWGTSPWMFLAGLLTGLAVGIWGVVRLITWAMEGPPRDGR